MQENCILVFPIYISIYLSTYWQESNNLFVVRPRSGQIKLLSSKDAYSLHCKIFESPMDLDDLLKQIKKNPETPAKDVAPTKPNKPSPVKSQIIEDGKNNYQ